MVQKKRKSDEMKGRGILFSKRSYRAAIPRKDPLGENGNKA